MTTFTAPMPATSSETVDMLEPLAPLRIVDPEVDTVEIEIPIPDVGPARARKKRLQIAARHDVVVPLAGRDRLLRVTPEPLRRRSAAECRGSRNRAAVVCLLCPARQLLSSVTTPTRTGPSGS
jgi:hypothetical protein